MPRAHVIRSTFSCAMFGLLLLLAQHVFGQQVFPPGTFSIDGIPVSCGYNITVLNPQLPDVGMNDLRGHIYINHTSWACSRLR